MGNAKRALDSRARCFTLAALTLRFPQRSTCKRKLLLHLNMGQVSAHQRSREELVETGAPERERHHLQTSPERRCSLIPAR